MTTANIRSGALLTETELQNWLPQLAKFKRTNLLLQKIRQKIDNHCDKAKRATKEALGKWSGECEALRHNLNAAAAKTAEQEQSIS